MKRREFLKTGMLAAAAAGLPPVLQSWVPVHNWSGYDFGNGPAVKDRLYQGPFGCYRPDDFFGGWCFQTTQPGHQQINCMGMGLTTYISGDFGAPVVSEKTLEYTSGSRPDARHENRHDYWGMHDRRQEKSAYSRRKADFSIDSIQAASIR